MNILLLTISKIDSINDRGIYTDLIRYFSNSGHSLYVVSPMERRFKRSTELVTENKIKLLNVKTLNLVKTNFIEKGIGILLVEYQFYSAIKRYFPNTKFDIVLYSTPPVTFTKTVQRIKKKYGTLSYLLLKDIFPQNAVDLNLLSKINLLYWFFRKKEKNLYKISDYIGCMSPANADYVISHNLEIINIKDKVEVCPNSIEVIENTVSNSKKDKIRQKYGIPADATVFIYGGNLGKPQGLDFLYEILKSNNDKKDRFFIIAGFGTEYNKIKKWFSEHKFSNAMLLFSLPKQDFDKLTRSCDVGMIFLDKRFTIPNYPSRLLSYLEYKLPILAATDVNTDVGKIAEQNNYGFWCENGDLISFNQYIEKYATNQSLITEMGNNGYLFLKNNYTVEKAYEIIMKHI
jgi:glycosyltransferase involved in cell wall biosynthesis